MAGDYYPDYYLKKRQRERVYRGTTWIIGIIVVVVLGIVGGFILFKNGIGPHRSDGLANADTVEQLQALQAEDMAGLPSPYADANEGAAPTGVVEEGVTSGELTEQEYGASLPHVQTRLEGLPGDASGGAVADPADPESDPHEVEPASSDADGPDAEEPSPEPVEPPVEESQPEPQDEETTPSESEPPAEEPVNEGAGNIYRVYAASYFSRSDADQCVTGLTGLGFVGQVIYKEPWYLVFVTSTKDFETANAVKKKLKDSGYAKAYVTRPQN